MHMILVRPNPVARAYPSSNMTLGFGVSLKFDSGPLMGVTSATNTSHWSILSNITAAISGHPPIPDVSWSNRISSE